MTIAVGVAKRVSYKAESTWGTVPVAAGAQALRRVTSMIDLDKDTYKSNEIRTDYQVADMRHGVRRVKGTIKGELSAGTWKDFMAAAVRQAYAALAASTGLSLTISGSSSPFTIARSAGSWLTDGYKIGHVGRITAGAVNAANSNKNLLITGVTALNLTVAPLNGVAMVAEGPIASCTFTLTGKQAYAPTSAQTDSSFSIEHWHSDVSLSEVYSGCKIDQMSLALPPTGLATVDFGWLGKDITTAASQYFTSPTAETTTGALAAVNGALYVQGTAVALLTGLSMTLKANMTGEPVVGSNTLPDILEGRIDVDGSMSVMLLDGTFRDYFINETEISLNAILTASNSATADFIGITLPRIKVGGAAKDDGEKGVIQTMPFTALLNVNGGTGISSEKTTILIQDSQA